MRDRRLMQLAALADMVKAHELARLSDLATARRAEEEALDACRTARTTAFGQAGPDAAHLAGADALWLRWNAREMETRATSAARAAAAAEEQRGRAQRAFGRAINLRKLSERRQS